MGRFETKWLCRLENASNMLVTAVAPTTSTLRIPSSPARVITSSLTLPAVEMIPRCQADPAANSRPDRNSSGSSVFLAALADLPGQWIKKGRGGLFIRTIGLARARTKIGLANLSTTCSEWSGSPGGSYQPERQVPPQR
jgi:hypothetical protein